MATKKDSGIIVTKLRHTGEGRYPAKKISCNINNPTFFLLESMSLQALAHVLMHGVLGRIPLILAGKIWHWLHYMIFMVSNARRRESRAVIASLISLFFVFSLSACSDKEISEEDQITALIERAVAAAENKELSKLVDIMAEGYSDKYNKDRKQAGKMLRLYFFRNKSIHLITKIKSIEILDDTAQQNSDEKQAKLQMYIGLAGRPVKGNSPLGVRADLLLFTMYMIKNDDEWLVKKVDWKRASQSDL